MYVVIDISNRIDSFNVRYQIETIRELSLVSILESITHNYNQSWFMFED